MKISVYGVGYVGLVAAACWARAGHEVLCMDIDSAKIENLKAGKVPFYEPGLSELVSSELQSGRLKMTNVALEAVEFAPVQIIAVGTAVDSQHVFDVVHTLIQSAQSSKTLVIKSTVPVGTAAEISALAQEKLSSRGISFDVCSNPEFLRQGEAIEDFEQASRVIVGVSTEDGRRVMTELYSVFSDLKGKMIFMDLRSAEMTKYAANALLATKISFMNEMALLAEKLHVDIDLVRKGLGSDPRIGPHFIFPGCGFGGSCFPKDLQSLIQVAGKEFVEVPLLKAVVAVNEKQKGLLFKKLSHALDEPLKGKTIAVWGLSFKPKTDDMREAPSKVLLESLWGAGAFVKAYDPQAMKVGAKIYGERSDLLFTETKEEALEGADALVICTEWSEFVAADLALLNKKLSSKVVIDGRNILNPTACTQAGLHYFGVGRA